MSDVLTHFKIENAAFKLELPQLRALPSPVLVHLHTKRGIFVVITEQGANTITYTDGISFYKVAIAEFSKSWTGFTLIAEPSAKAGELHYATKRKQERYLKPKTRIVSVIHTKFFKDGFGRIIINV